MESARCGRMDDVRRWQCGQDERSRNVHRRFARRTRARQVGVGWRIRSVSSEAPWCRVCCILLAIPALAWSIILLSTTTRTGPLLFGDSSEAGYDSCYKPSVCILSSTGHTEMRGTLGDMVMYCASLKTIRACDMLACFSWGDHSTSQVVQLQSLYVVSCP